MHVQARNLLIISHEIRYQKLKSLSLRTFPLSLNIPSFIDFSVFFYFFFLTYFRCRKKYASSAFQVLQGKLGKRRNSCFWLFWKEQKLKGRKLSIRSRCQTQICGGERRVLLRFPFCFLSRSSTSQSWEKKKRSNPFRSELRGSNTNNRPLSHSRFFPFFLTFLMFCAFEKKTLNLLNFSVK